MGLKHPTTKSFQYAFEGFKSVFVYEPNFRIHIVLGSLAVVLGLILGLDTIEWLVLTLTIFLVIILELNNTVMESIVDLVSPELQPAAKKAKDVSAAMVLVSAIFSVVVGCLLFLPKILLL